MSEHASQDAIARHLARNEKLLEVLDRHRADREQLRTIDFFFYGSDRARTLELAQALRAAGFARVDVGDEPRDGRWPVQAVLIDSIAAVVKESFVTGLVELARKHGAEFDGWGTSL